jgi:hypothetical protein
MGQVRKSLFYFADFGSQEQKLETFFLEKKN